MRVLRAALRVSASALGEILEKFYFLVPHVVDLLASFPKSGHKPESELRVKSYNRFKFRLQISAFCSTAAGPSALRVASPALG